MTTETAGIREIDTGALPDRFARGWHCLGPVKDYLDGKPHGSDAAVELLGLLQRRLPGEIARITAGKK